MSVSQKNSDALKAFLDMPAQRNDGFHPWKFFHYSIAIIARSEKCSPAVVDLV